jgi:hypothetical protein
MILLDVDESLAITGVAGDVLTIPREVGSE